MEHIDKKIPQNLKDALKEIGELSSLFYLYYHFNKKGWSVYRNFDEAGYDILLFHERSGEKIRLEVKTRQRIISSSKNKNNITHFTLTEKEKLTADFLIGMLFENNMFFIVPTNELKKTKSNNKTLYKFIIRINNKGVLDSNSAKYLNNWVIIKR